MRRLAFATILGAQVALAAPTAFAQDTRAFTDRLERLERDMNMLQRQVYRGSSGGAPVPVSPPDGNSAVNAELRMDQLETQLRTITGQLEETNYNVDQLKRRLEQLASDVDLRLSQLEKGGGEGTKPPPASAAAAPPGSNRGTGAGANPGAPASQSGVLGTLPADRPQAKPAPGANQSAAAPAALPAGTAQEQYNRAFGKLRAADYGGAEQELRAFIQRYPNDPLAGNAQYWLGETYYVRKDYNAAAAAFAESYRKYPQGAKGPDSLLKLGMSLAEVGQKRDACLTWSQLEKEYPKASANITERARGERQKFDCEKQR
jgi:tol-pal system protein YbgF